MRLGSSSSSKRQAWTSVLRSGVGAGVAAGLKGCTAGSWQRGKGDTEGREACPLPHPLLCSHLPSVVGPTSSWKVSKPPNFVFPRVPSSDPCSPHSTHNSKRISTQDFSTTYNLVTLRFPSSLSCSTTYSSSPFRGPMNNSRGNMHKSSTVILPPNYSCNIPTSRLWSTVPSHLEHTLFRNLCYVCYLSFLPTSLKYHVLR